jgi:hypothetical protein
MATFNYNNNNNAQSFIGLNTFTSTLTITGRWTLSVEVSELPPSGVLITVTQNGTTIATNTSPTSTQQDIILVNIPIQGTSGDVINTTISSAVATDAGLNATKTILNLRAGAV